MTDHAPRHVAAPGPGMRLLPWETPEGKPCYLSTDDPGSLLSRMADEVEEAQLAGGIDVLVGASAVLNDSVAGEHAVRFALRRATESLRDALRVADSRGARLPFPDDGAAAADGGRVATVRRDRGRVATVDGERLRRLLSLVCPSKAEVVAEAGGWSVFIPGLPVAAEGATFDEAVTEMVDALREYADDWQDRLHPSPNDHDSWGLVQLIALSNDVELADWLAGAST